MYEIYSGSVFFNPANQSQIIIKGFYYPQVRAVPSCAVHDPDPELTAARAGRLLLGGGGGARLQRGVRHQDHHLPSQPGHCGM